MIAAQINSVTGQALHSPGPPNRAVSANRQAVSTTKVRTNDNRPDTRPLEKAVNNPEPKMLNPTNRHAGSEIR